jgi:hypothetical protein
MAFFRILPFVKGTIFVDGIDITKIGVREVRGRFTMIPQVCFFDSYLFRTQYCLKEPFALISILLMNKLTLPSGMLLD